MLRLSYPHLTRRLLVIAIMGLSLAGCGQKGDLYLPDRGRAQAAPAAIG
jgi:predicted small lipoprotein YifL